MAQLETDALVLESRPYRETSLLATLLTRDRGRVGAMVRGARRGKSSLAAALQPLTLLRVRLAMSTRSEGGLATLASADIVWQPPFAHPQPQSSSAERSATLARMAYAGLFAEVLTHGEENDPHAEELFDLSRDFVMGLSAAPHPGSYAIAGLFALLGALGFAPQPPEAVETPDAGAEGGGTATALAGGMFHGIDLLEGIIASGFAGPPGPRGDRFVVLTSEETAALAYLLGGYSVPASGGPTFVVPALAGNRPTFVVPASAGKRSPEPKSEGDAGEIFPAKAGTTNAMPTGAVDGQVGFVVGRRTGAALLRLAVRLFEMQLECRLRSAKFLEEMILA